MMPDNLFGVTGLTPGGLGIWVLVFGLAAWWVRGMADRRRAANEGVTVESTAASQLIAHLQAEIGRLSSRLDLVEQDLRDSRSEVSRLRHRLANHETIESAKEYLRKGVGE